MQKITTRYATCKRQLLFFSIFILVTQITIAQKEMPQRAIEINLEADELIETEIRKSGRYNVATGLPVALYDLNFEVPQGSPESMAMYYLQQESKKLGIPTNEISNLRHHATRTTDVGSVVRYRQYFGNYPVNNNEVTITISPENKVVYVMNSYQSHVNLRNIQPSISENDAFTIANSYLNVQSSISFRDSHLVVYKNSKITKLAHEVVISATEPLGEWHVFIDALTGEIFKAVDKNCYYTEHDKNCSENCEHNENRNYRRRVNGTGMVFDPDPLTSNTVTYGGQYVDGNDATNASLDAARFSVTLNDITQNGSTYSLVGPRAEIIDFDTPNTGLFTQNSPDFIFNRQDQGFEPVNTYYHIDYMMNYINNTLGCDVMPYQYSGGVQYDPHGAGGADNSYYTGGAGRLSFGEGCVDDAEDSDVIHHELGHGLHDWVTSGGLSQVDGLSEGCGDYVAQSYNRGISIANGYWSDTDPAWNYVFNWDGHNPCWPGRTTDYGATYPGGLTGSIHANGQIWATCLMGVWDQIGQQQMDKIFYEGLGMTNGGSSQNDAANAVYQAAVNLNYDVSELDIIYSSLSDCGYTIALLHGPPVAGIGADNTVICLDSQNTVMFTDLTQPAGTSWTWTFEGGSPAVSNDQNPTVAYSAIGTFDVTLEVTNSEGTDTLLIEDYITVVSGDGCPNCTTTTNDTPVAISPTGAGLEYNSIINIPDSGEVIDVNVTNITGLHTWVSDLTFTLISPSGTEVELVGDICDDLDNFNFGFDDAVTPSAIPCPPINGATFVPTESLSAFNGEDAQGDWTLNIVDAFNQDGGQLSEWTLEVCTIPSLSIYENSFEEFAIFPNPNNGSFTIKLNSRSNSNIIVEVYDIRGRSVYNKSFNNNANFNKVIDLNNAQSGVYLVKVNDGDKQTIKKILVE
ncbi:T9SS type A sorting domain-containing protein [Hanstruepera ponticola]|uniref:T9SS type A sorting domain-containing protein n=1 Tax=Hanstruepera ponticola TaxID=2042995 RepID=UPI000CF15600|nr:T9SS type A sorting domain-containing protein [Hanstruepera ponticola]